MDSICVKIKLGKLFFPKGHNELSSNDGGYAIFGAKVLSVIEGTYDGQNIKLKGNVPFLRYSDEYKVWCELADRNNKYGDTYEIIGFNKIFEIKNKTDQRAFLEGILPLNTVNNIFDTYDDIIPILEEHNIEALTKVNGIGEYRANEIINNYEATKDDSEIYIKLKNANLSGTMIKKLKDYYGDATTVVDKVLNDTYDLVKLDGVGFTTADEIALRLGIDPLSEKRIKGFLIHLFKEKGEEGRSYLSNDEVINEIYSTLGDIPEENIAKAAKSLIDDNEIVLLNNGVNIASRKYFDLEKNIYLELLRIQKGLTDEEETEYKNIQIAKANNEYDDEDDNSDNEYPTEISASEEKQNNFNNGLVNIPDSNSIDKIIKDCEFEQGFAFTDEQIKAIKSIVDNNVIVITGSAGCGKTSTALGIVNLLKDNSILGCALSGQAALRLKQVTSGIVDCATIHKTLGYMGGTFNFNKHNKLPVGVLIVDESTMINGTLFYSLLQSVPTGAKVIMLGDVQQLAPIGNCQVFSDILNYGSDVVSIHKLTKIHRQAAKSGIITTSIDVVNQQQLFDTYYCGKKVVGELQDMVLDIYEPLEELDLSDNVIDYYISEYDKFKNVLDVLLCVPMRTRGNLSCYNLNTKLQDKLNPKLADSSEMVVKVRGTKNSEDKKYHFRVGDKVINKKNNYQARLVINDNPNEDGMTSIFNGNMGIIKNISEDSVIIDFFENGVLRFSKVEAENLELAYACTTHSVQGSGFKSVIVAMDNSSYVMNTTELLYTALTRAKKHCVLIGTNRAIRKAIDTKQVNYKQTLLGKFLNKELLVA